jgi:nucleoside-diphosphate-sugar epimerase
VVFDGKDVEGGDESLPYPAHYEACYPQTKAQAERLVLAANSPSLATVSLRPHLIWGPGDNHLVPRIVAKARSGRLRRIGNRPCLVDTVYVDNAARAHLLAADRLAPGSQVAGRAYFISNGEPVPLWDMVNRILIAAGLPPVTRSISPGLAYAAGAICEGLWMLLPLPGEPPMTRFVARELATAHWFNIDAARRDLGYAPEVSLAEGLVMLGKWLAGEQR